ncbi:MAG: alanine racemase, partial [Gammaproteobacteria bacterium]
EQLQCFAEATSDLEAERCIANSAAIMACPQALGDWVRPGIMLYGVSPLSEECGQGEGLLPVMTLKSTLIAVNDVKAGEAVGYGATWRCPQDMRIGIVVVWATGSLPSRPARERVGHVVIRGRRHQARAGNARWNRFAACAVFRSGRCPGGQRTLS